jgi:gamma-glutamylcysteine synthetase
VTFEVTLTVELSGSRVQTIEETNDTIETIKDDVRRALISLVRYGYRIEEFDGWRFS